MAVGVSSAADAEIARRDRALPGLEVLLDDERLTALLDEALPYAGLRHAEVTYLRYKPGTNCLARCRLTAAGGGLDAYVRLERHSALGKLEKHARKATASSLLGKGAIGLPGLPAVLYPQPNDRRLRAMAPLADDTSREQLLADTLPEHPALWSARLEPLRWKPERRFVALLHGAGGARALVKSYGDGYHAAARAATTLGGSTQPRTARCLGRSRGAGILVFEWLDGASLEPDGPARHLAAVGTELARLHALAPGGLNLSTRNSELRRVLHSVDAVGTLVPGARGPALRLAQQIALRLPSDVQPVVAHGDFSADQVLVDGDRAALVDLDEARLSDPLRDLGSFVAALQRDVVTGRLAPGKAEAAERALISGYGLANRDGLRVWAAAALLHLAPEPFRMREPAWPAALDELLSTAAGMLDG